MSPARALRIGAGVVVAAGLTAGCDSNPISSRADPCPDCVKISEAAGPAILGDAATVEAASVETDTLRLDLAYAGGCREHDFVAWAPPDFTGDAIPELSIWIHHDGHGDLCEALLRETAAFDLAPVRQLYLATFGVPGPIVLRVHATPDDETAVPWDLRAFEPAARRVEGIPGRR